ncbi:TPA: LPXTG cell wall anchor domain-containing protein, partial [Streptococcus suis]|nr:LPXTG cell wall anchor domain-containing protein [Streptococcus suis]
VSISESESTSESVSISESVSGSESVSSSEPVSSSESVSISESMSESTPIAIAVIPNVPAKTPVADASNLTDAEKAAVEKAVKDANPELADKFATVTVGNDGTVTITYTDGSVDTIPGSDVVEAKSLVSAKTPVSKQSVLPNTGENNSNIASVAGIALGISGLVALVKSKRRSEDK